MERSLTVHDDLNDLVEEDATKPTGKVTGNKDGDEVDSILKVKVSDLTTESEVHKTSDLENDILNADVIQDENRILRVIKRIQHQRNRVGYQNILEFARREYNNIDMEMFNKLINNLIAKNMVINKGKNGNNESFKIVEKTMIYRRVLMFQTRKAKKY